MISSANPFKSFRLEAIALACLTFGAALLPGPSSASQEPSPASPVQTFARQVERDWPGESQQQTLTVESLKHMSVAIESLLTGSQKTTFENDFLRVTSDIRTYASGIPGELVQAKRLRDVFQAASELIVRMADRLAQLDRRDPNLSAMRRAARSLDDDQMLLRQPDVIERFFDHAAAALVKIEAAQSPPTSRP